MFGSQPCGWNDFHTILLYSRRGFAVYVELIKDESIFRHGTQGSNQPGHILDDVLTLEGM